MRAIGIAAEAVSTVEESAYISRGRKIQKIEGKKLTRSVLEKKGVQPAAGSLDEVAHRHFC